MKTLRKFSRIAVVAIVLGVSGLGAMQNAEQEIKQMFTDISNDASSVDLVGAQKMVLGHLSAIASKTFKSTGKLPETVPFAELSRYGKLQFMTPKAIPGLALVAATLGYNETAKTLVGTTFYNHFNTDLKQVAAYGLGNGAIRYLADQTEMGAQAINKLQVAPEGWDGTNKLIKEVAITATPALIIAVANAAITKYTGASVKPNNSFYSK